MSSSVSRDKSLGVPSSHEASPAAGAEKPAKKGSGKLEGQSVSKTVSRASHTHATRASKNVLTHAAGVPLVPTKSMKTARVRVVAAEEAGTPRIGIDKAGSIGRVPAPIRKQFPSFLDLKDIANFFATLGATHEERVSAIKGRDDIIAMGLRAVDFDFQKLPDVWKDALRDERVRNSITSLDLRGCTEPKHLVTIHQLFPHARTLSLDVFHAGLGVPESIGELHSLENLDMVSWNKSKQTFLSTLPNLKRLTGDPNDQSIQELAKSGASLNTLQIRRVGRERTITDASAPLLSKMDLRHLDIRESGITATTFAALSAEGTNSRENLASIALAQISLEGNALRHVATLPNLRELRIEDCACDNNSFEQLRTSPLSHLSMVGNRNVRFGKEAGENLAAMEKLDTLDLRDVGKIDAEFFKALADGNSKIQRINVSECSLTDDAFQHIARLPHLKVLTMSGAKGFRDQALENLATAKAPITHLNLNRCPGITDKGIKALELLPHIERVNIANCTGVTGKKFEYVAKR